MPGFNKKGPSGLGPQTGRCMGPCTDNENASQTFGLGRIRGRGAGRGFGFFGFGRRNQLSGDSSLENEIDFLKDQIYLLEKRLGRDMKNE